MSASFPGGSSSAGRSGFQPTFDKPTPQDRLSNQISKLTHSLNTLELLERPRDAGEKFESLKPQLDRFKQNITTTAVDGDVEETKRREELSSVLEEIEKRSQEVLANCSTPRFAGKGVDSGEVARPIERLREAITHYQVSQQQAIYQQITDLSASLGVSLKLHERSPTAKDKLDSVVARLARLRLQGDDYGLEGGSRHEKQAELFNTLRLIRDNGSMVYNRVNAVGYEECEDDIQTVSGMVEDIQDALLDYQMAQQQAMYDQNCKQIDNADLWVLNNCRRASGAAYRHGNRRGCLRDTREMVLNEIELWTRDFAKSPVFWLNGLAGTGKSTIAQTISERVFADGLLGASFFCSRDFEDRSNLQLIFPTLAFQLAHKYPAFRSILVPLLRSDPDVVHESLYNQMEKLIIGPLKSVDAPVIITIDALDECRDEEPSSAILSVLGRFVEQIPRVKFFITGRPEPRIRTGFRLPLLKDATNIFVLHDVQPLLVNSDIRLFLKHELSQLAQQRGLNGWPSDKDLDILCHRAAGLFVYAVATVKFLDNKAQLPKHRLEVITQQLPGCTDPVGKARFNSKSTLDSLYTSILETAFGEEDPEVYIKARSTIGAVVLAVNPLPPLAIAEIIGLEPEEVMVLLTLVESLLVLDGVDPTQPVKTFHKSFPDFITDPSRCTDTRFYIPPGQLHFNLVISCLGLMNCRLKPNILSLPNYALNSEVEDLEMRINGQISVGLQYACKSWNGHLAKAEGDTTLIIPCLHVFLEEKFLAWLEVSSVLKATRSAVTALQQLVPWLQQVARNEELLWVARDYFQFTTKFFEPISVSATHIYHSALELSPLSSVVRRLYYHQRPTSSPRVVIGNPNSWDQATAFYNWKAGCDSHTWSPCGHFIATLNKNSVEIHDSLTLELLSTLTESNHYGGKLAYSPDGQFLACVSNTALIVWDILTGGIAKELQCNKFCASEPLIWSLDGKKISTTSGNLEPGAVVCTIDVASCSVILGDIPGSIFKPYLWAHNTSFRLLVADWDYQTLIVNIFEVGSILTKIESFFIYLGMECDPNGRWRQQSLTFSPITHHLSIQMESSVPLAILSIFNVQEQQCLYSQQGYHRFHQFSPDGNLFAASLGGSIYILKCSSGSYTLWGAFPAISHLTSVQLSPTSVSISYSDYQTLYVSHLSVPPIPDYPNSQYNFAVLSYHGNYMVAGNIGESTLAISNPPSQAPYHFIDTDMLITSFGLTDNILVVLDDRMLTAWRLTDEGLVDGILDTRRAGWSDCIWAVPSSLTSDKMRYSVVDQIVTIMLGEKAIYSYHSVTGELLEPTQTPLPLYDYQYHGRDLLPSQHYCDHYSLDWPDTAVGNSWPISQDILQRGWVKDSKGKHHMWIPLEWRKNLADAEWFYNITTLWHTHPSGTRIIMF